MKKFILLIILIPNISLASDGIWKGFFDINGHGAYDFTAIIDKNNIYAYTESAKTICLGQIEFPKDEFKTNLDMYILDGTKFSTAVIQGKVIENAMSGKFVTQPAVDTGNMYLVNINNKVISTKEKLGNSHWVGKNNKTDIKISFDNDNNIQGSDSNNCNYYGRLSPLNNFVYNVEIEIASCGTSDGFYYGMGYSYNNGSKKSLDITAIGNSFSLLINLTN